MVETKIDDTHVKVVEQKTITEERVFSKEELLSLKTTLENELNKVNARLQMLQ